LVQGALGLKGLEFRTLRHSAASLLRLGGVELFEISRQLAVAGQQFSSRGAVHPACGRRS